MTSSRSRGGNDVIQEADKKQIGTGRVAGSIRAVSGHAINKTESDRERERERDRERRPPGKLYAYITHMGHRIIRNT